VLDIMLDHHLEFAHRLATHDVHQHGIVEPLCTPFQLESGLEECTGPQPASDAALQACGMHWQNADNGGKDLVEPFSLLLSLLLPLFVALALASFPQTTRLLAMCFGGG
jgi:hypothetical protein